MSAVIETPVSLVSVAFCDQGVVRLVIQRRARRNALNVEVIEAFKARVEEIRERADIRFVVVQGEGPEAFCAGADRTVLASVDEQGAVAFITGLHQALEALRSLSQVTIAAVNGHCIGAGLELAAACDFRVASTTARFSMPEVLVGIPSVVEAALLPRLIGWGAATDLMLTGRTIDAKEASRLGLVQRFAGDRGLEAAVETLIEQLRPACPKAQTMQKRLFRRWEDASMSDAISAGVDALGEPYRDQGEPLEPHRRLGRSS